MTLTTTLLLQFLSVIGIINLKKTF